MTEQNEHFCCSLARHYDMRKPACTLGAHVMSELTFHLRLKWQGKKCTCKGD